MMNPSENGPTVVLDVGSSTVRVGLVGDDVPKCVFPAVVGHPRQSAKKRVACCFNRLKSAYVGGEVEKRADLLVPRYPIERGIVTNWSDLEKVWRHSFQLIGANPESSPLLLSQPYLKSKVNRKMLVSTVFEELRSPALHVAISGVLSLYASCRITGVALEAGDGLTQVIPVHEGRPIGEAIARFQLAGRDLSEYLLRMLHQREYYFDPLYHRVSVVNGLKESLCSVAVDFATDIRDIAASSKFLEKAYKLPDGTSVRLGAERFLCAEALFEPTTLGIDEGGIQQTVFESILACDVDLRKDLFGGIVLSGGCTLFNGFAERLRQEVAGLTPPQTGVNVLASSARRHLNWIGGSVLGSLSTFPTMLIGKQEYDEVGTSIVYRKNL